MPHHQPAQSMSKRLNRRLAFLLLILFVILSGLISVAMRQIALNAAKDNAIKLVLSLHPDLDEKGHHVTSQDALSKEMQRANQTSTIKTTEIRWLPAYGVQTQYSLPLNAKISELESLGLNSSGLINKLHELTTQPNLEVVRPLVAKKECLNCHQAKLGDTLGIVSVRFDLSGVRYLSLSILLWLTLFFLVSLLLTYLTIQRFFKPYSKLFGELSENFSILQTGQKTPKLDCHLDDEAGMVAKKYNLMSSRLLGSLEEIGNKTFFLVGYRYSETGDLVQDTLNNVDQLIQIYNFKRRIEQEPKPEGVYQALKESFERLGLACFSLFEANLAREDFRLATSLPSPNQRMDDQGGILLEKRPLVNCAKMATSPHLCSALHQKKDFDSFEQGHCCPNSGLELGEEQGHLCIPIIGEKLATVGLFVLPKGLRYYTDQVIPLIKSYLGEAMQSLEIRNAFSIISELALRDQLTGLYNRRFLDERAPSMQRESLQGGKALGLMLLDIDHFKHTNDTYGHAAGDQVLINVAKSIKMNLRKTDVIVRMGGEEFLILLVGITPEGLGTTAELIRKKIGGLTIRHEGHKIKKTISIGTSLITDEDQDLWKAIELADQCLYKAKETGRDRVVSHEDLTDFKYG